MNIRHLTKPLRNLEKQESDHILLNIKREMLRLLFEEHFLIKDARFMHCFSNKYRSTIKVDTLCRQSYKNPEKTSHLQVFLPRDSL